MGWPPTMPTLVAAMESRIGERDMVRYFTSWPAAMDNATHAPVIAAVRVPPSA